MENYLFEGNISVKAAVMGGMREVSEIIVDEAKKDRDTQWILHRAAERGIPIVTASRAHIDSLASGHTHGGLLARCGARRFQQLKEIDSEACFLALIEGIEDPFNFGMILRTLYAAGGDRRPRKRRRQRIPSPDHRGRDAADAACAEAKWDHAHLRRAQRRRLPV